MDWPLLRKADPEANTRKGGAREAVNVRFGQKQTFRSAMAMSALPPNVLQNYFEGLLAKH
jgi:hypothetical protein